MKDLIKIIIAGILGVVAGYLIMVASAGGLFWLIELMTGTAIEWNIWIAGLIGYLIFIVFK